MAEEYLFEKHRKPIPSQISIEGWSGTNSFNTNAQGESFSFQAIFPKTGYYTVQVQFSIPPGFNAAGLNNYLIKGELECIWTVEGNSVRRVCHVANGSSISGLGESVNVRLTNLSQSFAANTLFSASASVAPGTRPTFGGPQPPVFTPYDAFVVGPAGPNIDMLIPTDVGAYCYYLMSASAPGLFVAGATPSTYSGAIPGPPVRSFTANIYNQWTPIPPGASSIAFVPHPATAYVVFPLFGIEG